VKQFYTTLASPVGFLKLVASDNGLVAVLWEDDDPKRVRLGDLGRNPEHPVLKKAVEQLREYFAGKRDAFDVEIDLGAVGTDFQKTVWRALLDFPFGDTRSYAEIAAAVGRPDAVRRWRRNRSEPPVDCGSLPSRHRERRKPDRLRRRHRRETLPASARERVLRSFR
jgi:O6-methylguanine-DNA--protein-cysteine methyltransferase